MPAFFFLMKCVALRVSTQAATVLSGLDAETTRRYISIIRTVMAHTMTRTYRDWEGKLGGPHLVVEIDEAFLTKRKYHVGRQMPNESTIVFGITEREGGPTKIEDVQLYNYLIEKETWRSGEPVVIGQQRWHESFNICPDADRVHNDLGDGVHEHLTAMDEVPLDNGLVIEENTTQIVIGEGEDDDWEHEDSTPETNMSQPRNETTGRRAFRFNKALEAVEKKIFGPKERRGPKRTLFFVVPDRSAETLIPIVRKYVRPGTFIFSDKWMAYWQLRDGYFHFVVVHKKRFVQYNFFNEQIVIKVTTNHIERMWVELRRDMRGVKKEEVAERLMEVPYRLFRMASTVFEENFDALILDMKTFVADENLKRRGSSFQTFRMMDV